MRLHWYKIFTPIIFIVNIIIGIGLLASAYGGAIDPEVLPLAGVFAMTFPGWIILALIIAIIDLLWWRFQTIIIGAAILFALPSALNYCPLHITSPKVGEEQADSTFTLMTYNVFHFKEQFDNYPDSINPTFTQIINSGASIVCLQEADFMCPWPQLHVTSAQVDSIHEMYPYVYLNGNGQAILSKFPTEPIPLDNEFLTCLGADIAAYRVDVFGEPLNIFNVHLQSIHLTDNDKQLYRGLFKIRGNSDKIEEVKDQLVDKLSLANIARARQAKYLLRLIRHYGGTNVIVCGDFNDIPGCYSLRKLHDDAGLEEVYPSLGFGPSITYNANRFYFRIDHLLYRGNFVPVDIVRGNSKCSDHYPFTATFLYEKSKD